MTVKLISPETSAARLACILYVLLTVTINDCLLTASPCIGYVIGLLSDESSHVSHTYPDTKMKAINMLKVFILENIYVIVTGPLVDIVVNGFLIIDSYKVPSVSSVDITACVSVFFAVETLVCHVLLTYLLYPRYRT